MSRNSLVNLAVACMSFSPILKVFCPVSVPGVVFGGFRAEGSGTEDAVCVSSGESGEGDGGRRGSSVGTGTGGGGGDGKERERR